MQYPILRAMWDARLLPMNPIELFILDRPLFKVKNPKDLKVLLAHRDDADYPDCWHHPGGYLGGGERIQDAAWRVAVEETGLELGVFHVVRPMNFPKHRRDHELCIMVQGSLAFDDTPENAKKRDGTSFFPFGKLPSNLIPQHQLLQKRLEEWLSIVFAMPEDLRVRFLNFSEPDDSIY
jgi:ADP-ribose pyrophosphatase YjhB (NUDIX family)